MPVASLHAYNNLKYFTQAGSLFFCNILIYLSFTAQFVWDCVHDFGGRAVPEVKFVWGNEAYWVFAQLAPPPEDGVLESCLCH